MIKPVILVSRCLEHDHCRYDGSMITSEFVKLLKPYVTFKTICPEVEMGLTIPRESIRMVKSDRLYLKAFKTGTDVTHMMDNFLEELPRFQVDGAILKGRSPSCGMKDVKMYPDVGKVPALIEKSAGFFGGYMTYQYPTLPIEDEGRLRNYDIREHFLTRIYTMARFKNVKSIKELIDFHSRNKYLLMAYHQKNQKIMGRLVAGNKHISETLKTYESFLYESLKTKMKPGRNINMMMHIFGYFSHHLNNDEKAFFLDQLDMYRNKKLPMSSLMSVLYAWVLRFDIGYLKDQAIFEPYPKDIMNVMDSGKGAGR